MSEVFSTVSSRRAVGGGSAAASAGGYPPDYQTAPVRHMRGTIDHAVEEDGFAGGPLRRVRLVGHCHDRNRSFDLSPCLAAVGLDLEPAQMIRPSRP